MARRPAAALLAGLVVAMLLMPTGMAMPQRDRPSQADPDPSQSAQSTPPSFRAPAKWTYMVYMSADNNLEDEGILNLNQMESVGSGGGLDIVAQFDRSPDYDTTNGNWTDTRRFYVTQDSDPAIINSQMLQDLGEVDMGRVESLRDFIVWAVGNYTAERYYLDVWGHGGGWRDGLCNDYTSGTYIDLGELKVALAEAQRITGVALDAVGFDQCLMAQLEVYYEAKPSTGVLAGAEDLIPSAGFNYTRTLGALRADLAMDARGLGSAVVSTFFDEYGHSNERAFSALDAEAFDAGLVPAVTQLAQSLRAVAGSLHTEIKLARDFSRAFNIFDYIDLGNLTERLLKYLPANATAQRAAATAVREALDRTVIANDHGDGREGSEGVSIYFPQWAPPWSYSGLSLSKEQGWYDFLKTYFDDRDEPGIAPTIDVVKPYDNSVIGLVAEAYTEVSDADGNVTTVQWKYDRGDWNGVTVIGSNWSGEVYAKGLRPGYHRLSFRARDDDGLYSPEVQLRVYVQDRGLTMRVSPPSVRTYPGGSARVTVNVSTFGSAGGTAQMQRDSVPTGLSLGPLGGNFTLPAGGSIEREVDVLVDATAQFGTYTVMIKGYMVDAPLIATIASVDVNVTDPWPDLVAGPITFSPTDPKEGDNVTVAALVTNAGLAPAGAFALEIWHSLEGDRAGCFTLLGRMDVSSLAIGDAVCATATWHAVLGRHLFTAVADPSGTLRDLVPSDNSASRELLLEGHGIEVRVTPPGRDTTAGATESFAVTFTNTGNLQDFVQLDAEAPAGWQVKFNETVFPIDPRENGTATMSVQVPAQVYGGTTVEITVVATSYRDSTKFASAMVRLRVPELFALALGLHPSSGEVWPNSSVAFNLTIYNNGNGFENYTIAYVRQTADLLVSAVNDTIEVGPGCSTRVEVFVSSLGTPVGGREFQLKFTIKSVDEPTTYDAVVYRVRVARAYSLAAHLSGGAYQLEPGDVLAMDLGVTYGGNYCTTVVVALVGPPDLFGSDAPVGVLFSSAVAPGASASWPLELQVVPDALMGNYTAVLMAYESGSTTNVTRLEWAVEVLPVHNITIRMIGTSTGPLLEGGSWVADLMLRNRGDHPERVHLDLLGLPAWMNATLSVTDVTVPAYGAVHLNVTVLLDYGVRGARDGTYALVVRATPGNVTGTLPSAEAPLQVDVPEGPGTHTHVWTYLALAVLSIVAVAAVAAVRTRRRR